MAKYLIVILLTFLKINAQEFELGNVTVQELQQKFHPLDSSASAAILFKTGKVSIGLFSSEINVKTKIKIYDKEGYDWANFGIKYYKGGKVFFSNVATYTLVDGEIVKTKFKSKDELDVAINKYAREKRILLPNISESCIIEYEYTTGSSAFVIPTWYFQTSVPVNYSKYVAESPHPAIYNEYIPGIQYQIHYDHHLKGSIIPEKTVVKNNTTLTTYIARNIPAIKQEPFVNNMDNYMSGVSLISSTNWEQVTKGFYEIEDFGEQLNKKSYFKKDIDILIKGIENQQQKIDVIFNYVKSRMHWDGYDDFMTNKGVSKAYEERTGNVAEINLMLTAMLQYAGINANPVLISTRENGFVFFPNRHAYNYVITAIEGHEKVTFLDATDKFSQPDILPLRTLNAHGKLIRKTGVSADLDLIPKLKSSETFSILAEFNNNEITGKVKRTLNNHGALFFRQKWTNKTDYVQALESGYGTVELDGYTLENQTDLSQPVIERYDFKTKSEAEFIGDKIYISPLLFLTEKANPFKQEKREFPIDFVYPQEIRHNIMIEIPKGYTVESLPKSIYLSTENNFCTFKYNIAAVDGKIQIAVISTIDFAIVSSDFYMSIKDFYKNRIEKQNEKIVLKKL